MLTKPLEDPYVRSLQRRRVREEEKQCAKERTVAAASRTPENQIKRLDERLGEGVGAKKERARLAKKLGEKLLMCGHYQRQHPNLSATGCLSQDFDELQEKFDEQLCSPRYPLDD